MNVADNRLRSPSLVREDAIVGREIRAVASARGADEALAVEDRDVALVQSSGDIEDGVVGQFAHQRLGSVDALCVPRWRGSIERQLLAES